MREWDMSTAIGSAVATGAACREARPRRLGGSTDGPIRVSIVSLDQPARVVDAAQSVLSQAELARAERGTPDVRRRRILGRAALRMALAEQLGTAPEAVTLTTGSLGKPVLAGRDRPPIHFNSSTSGDLCLIALTTLGPVGADVEHASPHLEPAAPSFLAPAEERAVRRLPEEARADALAALWTCKEALLKGIGRGLQAEASSVVLSAPPALRVLRVPGDRAAAWSIMRLRPGPSAAAAVAVRAGRSSRTPRLELSVMPWK